jgi:RNA polymerase sigma-70 factor (ECF subfamily)
VKAGGNPALNGGHELMLQDTLGSGADHRLPCNPHVILLRADQLVQLLKAGGVVFVGPRRQDRSLPEIDFNEEEILLSASRGDREAFGALYERYIRRIFNYVYYRTGNLHDAEDLTARVFQRAMNHIHNYTDRGVPFSAWLYRIAHNLVANWHRDRSRRQEIPLSEVPVMPSKEDRPEASLVRSQEQDSLMRLIRQLPPERQTLLILKFVENLSNAEIGQVMGRSEGAVKSLYHRTLLALRDELGDQVVNLEGE